MSNSQSTASHIGLKILLTLTFALAACGTLFAQVTASGTIDRKSVV